VLSPEVSVPFTSGSSLQLKQKADEGKVEAFQFPLHRDPRCNSTSIRFFAEIISFSSLYIGILAATGSSIIPMSAPLRFSSLYIGILAATCSFHQLQFGQICFSSLYIGILAATEARLNRSSNRRDCFSSLYIGILAATCFFCPRRYAIPNVSVPFTSGSSLQRVSGFPARAPIAFQFPLHRDPRCNVPGIASAQAGLRFSSLYIGILAATTAVL